MSKIAPTQSLKWLTLRDVVASTLTLGKLVEREREALTLSQKLQAALTVTPPANAPRVLLLIGVEPNAGSLWYISPDSLHGRALEAAGGRNAIETPGDGPPELSMEALLKVNPDVIVGLADVPSLSPSKRAAFVGRFDVFPGLNAAQRKQVYVVARPGSLSVGPKILELVEDLRGVLGVARLGAAR